MRTKAAVVHAGPWSRIQVMTALADALSIEHGVSLRELNTFGLPAMARTLVRIRSDADVRRVLDHPLLGRAPKLVLGGGSNLVLTGDVKGMVLKVEIAGKRLVSERSMAEMRSVNISSLAPVILSDSSTTSRLQFLDKFGDRMPAALRNQLAQLSANLDKA